MLIDFDVVRSPPLRTPPPLAATPATQATQGMSPMPTLAPPPAGRRRPVFSGQFPKLAALSQE